MPGKTSKPELLAPAGDWECLHAAVANGADAVYFGLDKFNARYRAENFPLEELPSVVQFLHERNVHAFVAFNILIFPDELDAAFEYLGQIAAAGVDAVIVQDLGLALLVRQAFPNLELHASTQMTISDSRGAQFARDLGASQVVLAREMSVEQIARVHEDVDIPLEVFVHGALCVAYSGQCLTSEALGGRSANRGQCAQACRLPYELIVDGKKTELGDRAYLLSPQDLAGHEQIPALLQAGVTCFKIEGRLKGAAYVAATTRLYREAIDHAIAGLPFNPDEQKIHDLTMAFSRGFTPGFFLGNDHQKLVRGRFPKSRGLRIGTLLQIHTGALLVELDPSHQGKDSPLRLGDGIVMDIARPQEKEPGGRVFFVQKSRNPNILEVKLHGGIEWPEDQMEQLKGAIIWKTHDPDFLKRMESTFSRDCIHHRQPVHFHLKGAIGKPITLTAQLGTGSPTCATAETPLELSQNRPFQPADAIKQLSRLGTTPFEMGSFSHELPENAFVSSSVLNHLRRQVVEELQNRMKASASKPAQNPQALKHLRQEVSQPCQLGAAPKPRLTVLVRNLEQLEIVLKWKPEHPADRPALVHCDFEETRLYREAVRMAREHAMPVSLATLRVLKPGEDGFLNQILQCEPDALLIRNMSSLLQARKVAPQIRLLGDWSLNGVNELCVDFLLKGGLESVAPGNDLNIDQLCLLASRMDAQKLEVCAHLHMPMFHMEHCVYAAFLSKGKDHRDCGRPCDRHKVSLRDRTGAEFPMAVDAGCRNTVFNAIAQSAAQYLEKLTHLGVGAFRIELLRESPREIRVMLAGYSSTLRGESSGTELWRGLRASNHVGLTRGTLNLI